MSITVIGESNIDIMVMRHDTDIQGGCTPGSISFHYGGVARNIAHNLCLLGHEVKLMTVFGDDDFATRLIDDCKHIGMDLSLSTQYENARSPIFLSFNNRFGDMQSAVSDTESNERMDLYWLKAKMEAISHSDLVVADTLLCAEALAYLIDHCAAPLYFDAVSPKRAMRIADALDKSKRKSFFALKCNLAEAKALTGITEAEKAAKYLNANGIENVYLTLGEDGVVYCVRGETRHFPALKADVVNVTGAGDAFLAGVVHAHAIGSVGVEAVNFGLEMARLNTESEAPVNPTLRLHMLKES